MKKLFTIILLTFVVSYVSAQKIYNTSSGELIFGFSNANYNMPTGGDVLPNGNTPGNIEDAMRFTLWFHFGSYWHYDINNHIGFYTGITNRNIGFITNEAASDGITAGNVKWKRRAYALGVPLAIKIGNLENGLYIFGGAQYEMLYHYKEKEFLPSGKRKYTEWFSDRLNMWMPSVFAGVSFPHGLSIKVTYNLNNMMNEDYSYAMTDGTTIKPYKYLDSKLLYISVFQMIRWESITYKQVDNKSKKIALL